jgi:hypothetical protein
MRVEVVRGLLQEFRDPAEDVRGATSGDRDSVGEMPDRGLHGAVIGPAEVDDASGRRVHFDPAGPGRFRREHVVLLTMG